MKTLLSTVLDQKWWFCHDLYNESVRYDEANVRISQCTDTCWNHSRKLS